MTQMQTNPFLRQDTSEDFTGQHFYKWKNGESYQGEFYNNTFHGKGIYTWPDNISYSGFFYVNKRHGYGKQEFADGRAYTGLYLDDKQYGVGIITYPNGTEDVGYWKGDLLVRLCSTHPSIPPFNEIAIGYTAGPEKMRKSIDMLADLRKTNAVDEYLDNIELGSKFTPTMKEKLYASCVINPDSVFFNQNLFTRLFMRSLAIEKKQLIVKGPQKPKVEVEIGTKSTGPTSTPKTTKDISTTADQSKTKRKSKDSKSNLQNSQDTQTEDLHPVPSSVDTSVTTGRKQSRRSSTPELEDTKPDYPSVIQSWNSNPQHIELQKHTVRYQHFLAVTGFPMDKLMSCSREHLRPPGEVEAASNKLLQLAVEGDMRAITQLFVNESVYPDVSDGKGNTALLAATMWCHNDLIHCLLDMGADVNHCNDMGFGTLASLLVQLCPFGNLVHNINSIRTNTEDLLLECSTSPAEKIPDSKAKKTVGLYEMASLTRLPASQRHTKGSMVEESRSTSRKQAQKSGTPVVSTKSTTVPSKPLQDIIVDVCKPKKGNPSKEELLKTLKLLLGRGASINSVAVPLPPIFMAIRANEVSLLEMLLDSGGSPNLYHQEKDWGRLVPLHLTCSLPLESAIPFTTLLLKYGANPDLPTEDERSGQAETEEVFTSSVPSDKAFPTDGLTPLLIAASRPDLEGALELVKLLLQHKCNPSPPLYSGHSPLSLSIANGYSK